MSERVVFAALVVAMLMMGCARGSESIFTELSEANCPIVELDEETGSSRQLCPDVGEYALALLYDDDRFSLDVIEPGGKSLPLNFWNVVSTRFTSLGERAEWRVTRKGGTQTPTALIVPLDVFEDVDNPETFTSYLVVARITAGQACVTDKIGPGAEQVKAARKAADAAADRPCLPELATASEEVPASQPIPGPGRCDIWGVNPLAAHYLGVGPVWPESADPYPKAVEQLWQETFGIKKSHEPGRQYNYCLKRPGAVYGMSAVLRSETEGSLISIVAYDTEASCKDQNYADQSLTFPERPLSQGCPFLAMGASKADTVKQLGPAHAIHGQSWYYLETPEHLESCRSWLKADEDGCCFPGMSLTFSNDRLDGLVIHNGGGSGPPCDDLPEPLDTR